MPLITLTTDFGTRDGYAAQMKGVVLGINPNVKLIDVTHDIDPFSILEAALVLKGVSRYYKPGVIHVAVVDPGVGSSRRGIVAAADGRFYVGPDNGIFSLVLGAAQSKEVREIRNPLLVLDKPHPTFHGRDVFAPVAAHLSLGARFDSIGPLVRDPVSFSIAAPELHETQGQGEVIYIDRFGNLTTNIEGGMLSRPVLSVRLCDVEIRGLSRFYGEAPPGQPLALINSFGYLEIAVNGGNAARELGVDRGERVILVFRRET
jgi:hypothetical protein